MESNNNENKVDKPNILDIIKKYKRVYFLVLLVIFVASIVLIVINVLSITKDNGKKTNTTVIDNQSYGEQNSGTVIEQQNLVQRKIDGVMVSEGEENELPYATIIENSVDARPLSGINEANIIYEVQAEGTITRFLAIYANKDKIDKIGPVRSARPYYADLADEYNPLFIHFGGSPEVLEKINNGFYNFTDMNGIVYDLIYFYRDSTRNAPHNAYTSTDLIEQYLEKIGDSNGNGNYTSWKFSNTPQNYNDQKDIDNIDVIYNKDVSLYNVTWKYNKDTEKFTRYLYGGEEKYLDDNNNDVTTDNIVIQFATSKVIDDAGRKSINLTEGGKAIIIRDGKYIEGYWAKNNILNRTQFFVYDENNNVTEYEFKPGKIWIHIVPKENYDLIKK